ncbi:MAG: ATP-binding protein [Bacillota bacterium]|nr:ATP-binding protein [Bacillota bacterium]
MSRFKRSYQQDLLVRFSDLPSGVSIATDVTCREIIHNPTAALFFRLKDWEDYPYTSLYSTLVKIFHQDKLLSPQEIPIYRSAVQGDRIIGVELKFVWQDGISKTAIWSSSPLRDETGVIIGAIATFEEVTGLVIKTQELDAHQALLQKMVDERTMKLRQEFEKRQSIEREIARLEKLNVIGQLAAGLAHEVRNPMTTIRGFLQLFQSKNDLHSYNSYFSLMIEELDRANSIIHEFLTLSKNKTNVFKLLSLNKLITGIFPLIQADALSQGKKSVFEAGNITDLEIDANEIIQLILNLARNGLEAMPKEGCLTIKTYMDEEYVVLGVKDEGTGIKPEHVLKLGTPFFTTKETGTGLGIPICYDIAERHNAVIDVETGQGGTVFKVKFSRPKASVDNSVNKGAATL